MSKDSIRPLPGKAIVEFEPYWDRCTGSIVTPSILNGRLKTSGKVLAVSPTTGSRNERTEASLKGQRVLVKPFSGLRTFSYLGLPNLAVIKIEDIEALLDSDPAVAPGDGAVARCKFCGPALATVSTNAMMLQDSPSGPYCPRCHRGVNGELIDPLKVKLTPGFVEKTQDQRARMQEYITKVRGEEPKRKTIVSIHRGT